MYKYIALLLVLASLIYYGHWNPVYLPLLISSIIINYSLGSWISSGRGNKKILMIAGVALNLGSIGFFKYAEFIVNNVNVVAGSNYHVGTIVLPLAISFFTFQQIAFLVDAYRGETKEYGFINYCLFVTFFPQLIAGPIVHHREMMPQFANPKNISLKYKNMVIGIAIFTLGLFKKVVIADNVALYAKPVFDSAEIGLALTFIETWGAALAYTFQLYFDFSGYSDMAIGLARMFGIILPINFFSPYKARNMIDFWRRWHMTLSRFLKDCLYIPLGGNKKGTSRRYINLMITMLLGGLWHGASWTFVIWGGLHGVYLAINHGWKSLVNYLGFNKGKNFWGSGDFARILTFMAIVVGWVFFRAESLEGALLILKGMAGLNGVDLPDSLHRFLQVGGYQEVLSAIKSFGISFDNKGYFEGAKAYLFLFALLIIVWYFPNTMQTMYKLNGTNVSNLFYLFIGILLGAIVIYMNDVQTNEFLYFNF